MESLARSAYLDSVPGELLELPRAGTALENPFVYDACAKELEDMARRGLIEIVRRDRNVVGGETLIDRIQFVRVS